MYKFLVASLAALAAAAPALPQLDKRFFSCDVSHLSQPSSTLPAPPSGLTLMMVAIGQGTQNYTCATANSSDPPSQVGALANLYNASCLAANSQEFLNIVTGWAAWAPPGSLNGLPRVGQHFYTNTTSPTFRLNTIGTTETSKAAAVPAPANNDGNVPWVYLKPDAGATTDIGAVYRFETHDGSAPATCEGKAAGPFQVAYAAQYWFYKS